MVFVPMTSMIVSFSAGASGSRPANHDAVLLSKAGSPSAIADLTRFSTGEQSGPQRYHGMGFNVF